MFKIALKPQAWSHGKLTWSVSNLTSELHFLGSDQPSSSSPQKKHGDPPGYPEMSRIMTNNYQHLLSYNLPSESGLLIKNELQSLELHDPDKSFSVCPSLLPAEEC